MFFFADQLVFIFNKKKLKMNKSQNQWLVLWIDGPIIDPILWTCISFVNLKLKIFMNHYWFGSQLVLEHSAVCCWWFFLKIEGLLSLIIARIKRPNIYLIFEFINWTCPKILNKFNGRYFIEHRSWNRIKVDHCWIVIFWHQSVKKI